MTKDKDVLRKNLISILNNRDCDGVSCQQCPFSVTNSLCRMCTCGEGSFAERLSRQLEYIRSLKIITEDDIFLELL